jgi:hypothetical protein
MYVALAFFSSSSLATAQHNNYDPQHIDLFEFILGHVGSTTCEWSSVDHNIGVLQMSYAIPSSAALAMGCCFVSIFSTNVQNIQQFLARRWIQRGRIVAFG